MGKTITNILYQVNPDIYNGIDPNTIDYKDYYGNVAGGIFNAILGTDTTTGKTQAYLDVNDFAAIALQLYNKKFFTTSAGTLIQSFDTKPTIDEMLTTNVLLYRPNNNRRSIYVAKPSSSNASVIAFINSNTNEGVLKMYSNKSDTYYIYQPVEGRVRTFPVYTYLLTDNYGNKIYDGGSFESFNPNETLPNCKIIYTTDNIENAYTTW